jgi:serine/threonine protein kinase
MHYAFQDSENLYLVMDLMPGGDLRFHISRHKKFSEEQTRFFICGIIIALEYIHSNNVIHRDIKPENLVLDENGYVRLTDFGIAKENMPDNKSETSGTPGYMSPEVMKALNHSFPVDFFALGVIGYEFMKGERPYVGKNRKEIKEQILAKQVELKTEEIGEGWSKESADFINKLLIRKPENRIGYKGINELKLHPWLKYYPWEMLYNKTLPSPFIPENKDNFDRRYCESSDVITEETKLRYEEILMDDTYRTAFKKFYYNTDEDYKRKNNNKLKNKGNNKEKNNSDTNNTSYNKIIINQSQKIITDMNNVNNNGDNSKNGNKTNNLKNSMKIIPSSATRNLIVKNHKKSGSAVNYNKNLNNNINTNSNTNLSGNVSNNVIYINFNINNPNIGSNIYNNHQHISPKTDRAIKQYKNSAKNIYCQGNTINNLNNNNSLIHKIGINIGSFVSPMNSMKKIKNNNGNSGNKTLINNNRKNYIQNNYKKKILIITTA